MKKLWILFTLAFAFVATIVPPQPAKADYPAMQSVSGNPLTSGTAPYLVMSGLSGQSACSVTITVAPGGTFSVEGHYKTAPPTQWTSALTVVSPDGVTQYTTISAVGSYALNCGGMDGFRVDGTSATGTPNVILNANGGISRVLGAGVNGGRTNVVGSAPITVTNAGNTATVAISPLPLPILYGGTGATAVPAGCVTSDGTSFSSTACPTPGVTVSVQGVAPIAVGTPSPGVFVISDTATAAPTPNITSGPGIAVDTPAPNTYVISNTATAAPTPFFTSGPGIAIGTPSANNYVVSNTGVTSVTGVAPISVSAGPTPAVSLTNPLPILNGGTGTTSASAGLCVNAASTTAYETALCGQIKVGSFVIPSIGGTVTLTSAENKLFNLQRYTPIFVSDGTHAVQGYANATVTNSTTVVLFMTAVDQGAVGNTMAANAYSSISGLGSTLSGSFGASNCVVTDASTHLTTATCNNWQLTTFTLPALGGSVSVSKAAGEPRSLNLYAGQPVWIVNSSGTNEWAMGHVGATILNGSSFSFVLDAMTTGSPSSSVTNPILTTGGIASLPYVSSVTAGTNLNNSGTASAPTLNLNTSVSIPGNYVSTGGLFYVGTATPGNHPQAFGATDNQTPTAMNDTFGTDDTQTVSGVTGKCGVIADYNGTSLSNTNLTIDCNGNVGARAAMKATGFNASGLTASKCVQTDGSKNLASAAGTCAVSYANGTIIGGTHIETGSANVPASSTVTFTFGSAYSVAPICALSTTGTNLGSVITVETGYPTTTQIQLYNSFSDRIGSFVCVGS